MEKKLIYLNNAATSWPKPPLARSAVMKAMDGPPQEAYRSSVCPPESAFSRIRERMARIYSSGDPSKVVLTPNATTALNIAIQGFVLKRARAGLGTRVVTTAAEHNSVLRPLLIGT
jgi:selenocysteine lyase/cysteine desulfurase